MGHMLTIEQRRGEKEKRRGRGEMNENTPAWSQANKYGLRKYAGLVLEGCFMFI